MLPGNLLFRTFFIRAGQYGTAFTLDIDGREFLITASHLLSSYKRQQSIQIFRDKKWHIVDCELVGVGNGELDVAVLKTPARLTDSIFTIDAKFGDCFIGQDVFFIGFPYKMWVDYGPSMSGHPGVFLKKGALSAVDQGPPKALYVDALNNEGFSGGPLYYYVNGDMNTPCVAGVVSKYKVEYESVSDGKGEVTEMKIAYNTGFLVAYDIAHALQLARNTA